VNRSWVCEGVSGLGPYWSSIFGGGASGDVGSTLSVVSGAGGAGAGEIGSGGKGSGGTVCVTGGCSGGEGMLLCAP